MSEPREQFEESTDYTFSMAISKDPEERAKYWKAYAKWLQEALDKLKERIGGARKMVFHDGELYAILIHSGDNHKAVTAALVELTPEEMENDDE